MRRISPLLAYCYCCFGLLLSLSPFACVPAPDVADKNEDSDASSSSTSSTNEVSQHEAAEIEIPRSLDDRLVVELFASDPMIVTPVGIVVDNSGRVLVVESNTHFQPDDYDLHPTDRILAFEDADGVGQADRVTTYFDGLTATMHITLDHDGSLLVCTRSALHRLRDTDDDGVADENQVLLELESEATYPHNGLFSCRVDFDGSLWVSMGENLGVAYRLVGSDGTSVADQGEGGNVFHCDSEGGHLRRVATGFWNPVQLDFDAFGRLFTIDNDPDSRPPCRLIHVAERGNYGYQYRLGRRGTHPFSAWDGELPGTLPMVMGTGEAPSGLLFCEDGILPEEYRGSLLITSWSNHRIERYTLTARGASLGARSEPLIVGGENFRPVAMATSSNGSMYVTDWVDHSYPVHGKGRIWRIRRVDAEPSRLSNDNVAPIRSVSRRTREQAARRLLSEGENGIADLKDAATDDDPRIRATALGVLIGNNLADEELAAAALADDSSGVRELAARLLPADLSDWKRVARDDASPAVWAQAVRRLDPRVPEAMSLITTALVSADPFLNLAGRDALLAAPDQLAMIDPLAIDDDHVALQIVISQYEAASAGAEERLGKLLRHANPEIRFMAIRWIGEQRLETLRQSLLDSLEETPPSSEVAIAALAALSMLQGIDPLQAERDRTYDDFAVEILFNPDSPLSLRQAALRRVRANHPRFDAESFREWLSSESSELRMQAVRSLRETSLPQREALLASVVSDRENTIELRAEAIVGLNGSDETTRILLLDLALGDEPLLQAEAIRSLRGAPLTEQQRRELDALADRDSSLSALVQQVISPGDSAVVGNRPLPSDVDAWLRLLEGPADSAAGQRIFFHAAIGCAKCHRMEGRGGAVGPDLTLIGRMADRRRVVESILQPSREIAPQFYAWQIVTVDGRVHTGMFEKESNEGRLTYRDTQGRHFHIQKEDVEYQQAERISIMPDDIVNLLTEQEFRDVVAFLTEQR